MEATSACPSPVSLQRVSVAFITRDRRELLEGGIRAAMNQTVASEIIVMDDASNDGTAEMMAEQFPAVRYHRNKVPRGVSYQKCEAVRLASHPIVFIFDDDAQPLCPRTVEHALAEFEADPRIAVVAIPFQNVLFEDFVRQAANRPHPEVVVGGLFVGCAHAVRRDIFLRIGGYRHEWIYGNEEMDLLLRLLQAGYFVRWGTGQPVSHFQKPFRLSHRVVAYSRRADILLIWWNAPFEQVLIGVPLTILNGLLHALRKPNAQGILYTLHGVWMGLRDIVLLRHLRQPVSRSAYLLYRRMKRRDSVPLTEAALMPGFPPPIQAP